MKLRKTIKIITWASFGIYCILILLTFFRTRTNFADLSIADYWKRANFIPFKTIINYLSNLVHDSINFRIIFSNLFGNLIVFLPMGFFLPILFLKSRTFLKTNLIIFVFVMLVEVVEAVFRIGVFDIDDIMLNILGAMIGYTISRVPLLITKGKNA